MHGSTIDDLLSTDGHSVHTDIEEAKLFINFSSAFTEEHCKNV